ncbi:hypothetical protein [Arcobacter peruensis]|uniref:hypothetical protein n=1 Tax=Arcobacter peruensis TaxID=2320140 RepID=UPI000F0757CF|nr:hypothetical protein [Arcobacter peruensis]
MTCKKEQIILNNNRTVGEQTPVIISASKNTDIPSFNTYPHMCNYCYANTSKEIAKKNYKMHLENTNSESIL